MRLKSRMARRVGGAAIAVCVGVGIPASAMAATDRPAAPAQAAVAPCTPADLDIWAGVPGAQGLEQSALQIQLSDISARPCTLDGFPRVLAVSSSGRQLGDAAGQGAGKFRLITLRYGQTAHFTLGVIDVSIFSRSSCDQVTAAGLTIYAPGDHGSGFIPLPLSVCAKPGIQYMTASTVLNGTGVPDLAPVP
jgi:Domain of unknown function (DUF4232)